MKILGNLTRVSGLGMLLTCPLYAVPCLAGHPPANISYRNYSFSVLHILGAVPPDPLTQFPAQSLPTLPPLCSPPPCGSSPQAACSHTGYAGSSRGTRKTAICAVWAERFAGRGGGEGVLRPTLNCKGILSYSMVEASLHGHAGFAGGLGILLVGPFFS